MVWFIKKKARAAATITLDDGHVQKITLQPDEDLTGSVQEDRFMLSVEPARWTLRRVGEDALVAKAAYTAEGRLSALKMSGRDLKTFATSVGEANVMKLRARDGRVDLLIEEIPPYYLSGVYKKLDIRGAWNEPFSAIAREARGRGLTLLDYDRLYTLWQCAGNVRQLDGAFVEIGVYKGGSSFLLAEAQRLLGRPGRLYSCDTFQGHAEASPDHDAANHPGMFSDTDEAAVRALLRPYEAVTVVAGDIKKTAATIAEDRIALVHLDVDVYEPTKFCLEHFGPKIEQGGVIIVDDYASTTCPGVKLAVDAYAKANPHFFFLHLLTGQALLTRIR